MGLAFKVDENLLVEVAEELRQAGHDAVTVGDQALTGGADPDLAAVCQREGRALVTLNLDFADILTYPPDLSPGIVAGISQMSVLRLAGRPHLGDPKPHSRIERRTRFKNIPVTVVPAISRDDRRGCFRSHPSPGFGP